MNSNRCIFHACRCEKLPECTVGQMLPTRHPCGVGVGNNPKMIPTLWIRGAQRRAHTHTHTMIYMSTHALILHTHANISTHGHRHSALISEQRRAHAITCITDMWTGPEVGSPWQQDSATGPAWRTHAATGAHAGKTASHDSGGNGAGRMPRASQVHAAGHSGLSARQAATSAGCRTQPTAQTESQLGYQRTNEYTHCCLANKAKKEQQVTRGKTGGEEKGTAVRGHRMSPSWAIALPPPLSHTAGDVS